MNSKVKYTIIVVVIAIVIYIAYRFFKKPKEVKDVVKQPIQTESGNEKQATQPEQAQGFYSPGGASGAGVVDIKSGGANVSNLSNGLDPDLLPVSSTLLVPIKQISIDPHLGPVVTNDATGLPNVSDLSNGLDADQPPLIP